MDVVGRDRDRDPDRELSAGTSQLRLRRGVLALALFAAAAAGLIWPLFAITTDEAARTEPERTLALEVLRESCLVDIYAACDELYRQARAESHYAILGDRCNGRLPEGAGVWCVDALGSGPSPLSDESGRTGGPNSRCSTFEGSFTSCDDPTGLAARSATDPGAAWLLLYWTGCEAGDNRACDRLAESAPSRSVAEEFGATCGSRLATSPPADAKPSSDAARDRANSSAPTRGSTRWRCAAGAETTSPATSLARAPRAVRSTSS